MKVSRKVDYGVRALVDLAQRYGQGAVHSGEIAARQSVPESYLEQVLAALRKAGFVRSRSGPQGGHALARPPAEITVAEVMAALEGATAPTCVGEPTGCERSPTCAQRDVWREVEEATQRVLSGITIGDLAHQQQRREEVGVFYI